MSEKNRSLNKEQIKKLSESVVGKTFGELGEFKYNLEDYNYKGGMGILMEENVFEYNANNDSNPDFLEEGIELKVTPVKRNKNGSYSAKERLVLNIINYMEEYKNTFETSAFWHKNNTLNLMFYLWEEGLPRSQYRIIKHLLYTYPEEDLLIIKQDWEIIINKIRNGLAHEISEADTLYLGACTKGKNKDSLRKQPFSNEMAKQRAFCLKNSYMTSIVRTHINNQEQDKIATTKELYKNTFEEIIYNRLSQYSDVTVAQMIDHFNLNPRMKDINERLVAKMLDIKGKVSECDEFQKANIVCKTIRLDNNYNIKESMSFPAFKYNDIVKEVWETSTLRKLFAEKKYLFIIFKQKGNDYYFEDVRLWNMPLNELDVVVKQCWECTVDVIRQGKIVKSIDAKGVRKTNFPGMGHNGIIHVRPHATNANDVYDLPVNDKLTGASQYTKQSFWLNNTYVKDIIL